MKALALRIGLYRVAAILIGCALVLELIRVQVSRRQHARGRSPARSARSSFLAARGRRLRDRPQAPFDPTEIRVLMGKGYAEGPAAEEAERRLEELAAGRPEAAPTGARGRVRLDRGRARASLPRLARRGRSRRAVRVRRGLRDHGRAPRDRVKRGRDRRSAPVRRDASCRPACSMSPYCAYRAYLVRCVAETSELQAGRATRSRDHPVRRRFRRRDAADRRPVHERDGADGQRSRDAPGLPGRDPRAGRLAPRRLRLPGALRRSRHLHARATSRTCSWR